jgi:hypothetical protein
LVQRLQHFHTAATRLDLIHLDPFMFILFHSIDSQRHKKPIGLSSMVDPLSPANSYTDIHVWARMFAARFMWQH